MDTHVVVCGPDGFRVFVTWPPEPIGPFRGALNGANGSFGTKIGLNEPYMPTALGAVIEVVVVAPASSDGMLVYGGLGPVLFGIQAPIPARPLPEAAFGLLYTNWLVLPPGCAGYADREDAALCVPDAVVVVRRNEGPPTWAFDREGGLSDIFVRRDEAITREGKNSWDVRRSNDSPSYYLRDIYTV